MESSRLASSDEILVVKVKYFVHKEELKKIHQQLVEMRNSGVVVLSAGMDALVIPKDTTIMAEAVAQRHILYGNGSIVYIEDESAGEYADQPTLQSAT